MTQVTWPYCCPCSTSCCPTKEEKRGNSCPRQGMACTPLLTTPKMLSHLLELYFLPYFPSRLVQWKTFMWQTPSLPSISSSNWQMQAPPRTSSSPRGASHPPWSWSTWEPEATPQTRWPGWVSVDAPHKGWVALNWAALIVCSRYLDYLKVSLHHLPSWGNITCPAITTQVP